MCRTWFAGRPSPNSSPSSAFAFVSDAMMQCWVLVCLLPLLQSLQLCSSLKKGVYRLSFHFVCVKLGVRRAMCTEVFR